MQYEQTELQPIEICTQAWKARSRRARQVAGEVAPLGEAAARDAEAAGADPVARCGIEPGPNATSTYG